jgi:hypothetical protein
LLRDLGKQLIGDVSWIGLQLLIADKDERSHRRGEMTSLTSLSDNLGRFMDDKL